MPKKKEKLPLSKTHSELAKELIGANAAEISRWSKEKFGWKCSKGHYWEASPESRTHLKSGCPYCAGSKAISGENDLKTKFPKIAEEAYGWDPSTTAVTSQKKLKWKCDLGHIWESNVANRTKRGDGCTFCSGKKVLVGFNDFQTRYPELAKQLIDTDPTSFVGGHQKLRWKCDLGHIWFAQVNNRVSHNQGCPICSNKKILIGFNDFQTTHKVLAEELVEDDPTTFSHGASKKLKWKCPNGHIYLASPMHRSNGTGCSICAGKQILIGFNDFQTTDPLLARQLFEEDPKTFTRGTSKFLKWKCDLGHIWKAQTSTVLRAAKFGCPYCIGQKVLIGFNDLATTQPEVSKLAFGWNPQEFTAGSNFKKKWKCPQGHIWNAVIRSVVQSNKSGCPTCSKSGFDPNENGYLYFLTHKDWAMYQIGITNFPEDRIYRHKRLGWEIKEIRGPMDGHLTQQWETAMLRMLKEKGADLSNSKIAGKFDGYSESWSKSKFEVKSIKELMQLTEEFEDEIKY